MNLKWYKNQLIKNNSFNKASVIIDLQIIRKKRNQQIMSYDFNIFIYIFLLIYKFYLNLIVIFFFYKIKLQNFLKKLFFFFYYIYLNKLIVLNFNIFSLKKNKNFFFFV